MDALREAVTNHVLVQKADRESYGFRHALMREAVYEDLLPGERGGLHVRLAEALEGDPSLSAETVGPAAELAWHWHQAHELRTRCVPRWRRGGQAEQMRAPAEAARHFENALDLWERVDDPEGIARHDPRGAAAPRGRARATSPARPTGRWRSLGAPRSSLDPGPTGGRGSPARAPRPLPVVARARPRRADEYQLAVELMPAEPPSAERALVVASLAQVLMLIGRLGDSRDLAREAIEIARRSGARTSRRMRSTRWVSTSRALGERDEGIGSCAGRSRSSRSSGAGRHPPRLHEPLRRARPGRAGRGGDRAGARGAREARELGHRRAATAVPAGRGGSRADATRAG